MVKFGLDSANSYVQANSTEHSVVDPAMLQGLVETVGSVGQGVQAAGGVGNYFSNMWQNISGTAKNVVGGFKDGFGAGIKNIGNLFKSGSAASGAAEAAGAAGNVAKGAGAALKSIGSAGLGLATSILGNMSGKDLPSNVKGTREAIRSGLQFIPGVGQGIAAATAAIDFIGDKTGLNLDHFDKNAAKRFDLKGMRIQNAVNALPGASMFVGMWGGDTIKARKSDVWDASDGIARAAYAKTAADVDAASKLGGRRTLINRKAMNSEIRETNRKDIIAERNVEGSKMALEGSRTAIDSLQNQHLNRLQGTNNQVIVGKQGMVLPNIQDVRKILSTRKFQAGGKMNVIVEGAFHSRKNHLSELNPELEDITPKGIPVITRGEGGEIIQTAEVEQKELILHLELTQKLEALYQDGSEEAMIEAGKLLAEEIMNNTDDRTGKVLDNGTNEN